MTIVYTTRFRDLWLFNSVHQLRSVAFQTYLFGFSALLAWLTTRGDSCATNGNCLAVAVFTFVLVYVLFATLQFAFNAVFLFARNNKNVLTEHRLDLRDDGISEESAYARSHYLWPGLHRVVTVAGFVVVYVTAHSALLIPDKAFRSAEERAHFLQAVKSHIGVV